MRDVSKLPGKEGWRDEITVWEADVPMPEDDSPLWVAVETDGSDGKGWLVAGSSEAYISHVSYSYGVHGMCLLLSCLKEAYTNSI